MKMSKKTTDIAEVQPDEVRRMVGAYVFGSYNAKTDSVEFHFDGRNEHFIGATVTRTTVVGEDK